MDLKVADKWSDPPPWESYEVKIERMIDNVDYEELCEIFQWLRENISGEWTDRTFIVEGHISAGLCFHFQHEEDAIAFKMRWL